MSSATIESTIVFALRLREMADCSDARVPTTTMSCGSGDDCDAATGVVLLAEAFCAAAGAALASAMAIKELVSKTANFERYERVLLPFMRIPFLFGATLVVAGDPWRANPFV